MAITACRNCILVALVALLPSLATAQGSGGDELPAARWWKGNTHTHTWWSDGDSPPESVAAWYASRGYHFLVLSDHHRMQHGQVWYPVDTDQKRDALTGYVRQFGKDWVEMRQGDGVTVVKLKTLHEFRALFENANQFIFVQGEEITDRFEMHPVHINGVNIGRHVAPRGGASVADVLQNNLDAVLEQGRMEGRPVLAHVNHPNFHYAITAEDLVSLDHRAGEGFVEIYNGHSGVNNHGDPYHPGMERMWDITLALRLGRANREVTYGIATDDAHVYTRWGLRQVNPGRGWVMVRSRRLTPDSITSAMRRGDFYSSTGVTLRTLTIDDRSIEVEIEPEQGVTYAVEFIGTRRKTDLAGTPVHGLPADAEGRTTLVYGSRIGEVLERTQGIHARYDVKGDEIYVRARVTSSKLHPNPFAEGDFEMAWTQPLVVKTAGSGDTSKR